MMIEVLNVGPGRSSEADVIRNLKNFEKIKVGEVGCLTLDVEKQNLRLVDYGAVMNNDIHKYAHLDPPHHFKRIYVFNVLGEIMFSENKAEQEEFSREAIQTVAALKEHLVVGGKMVLGESITPWVVVPPAQLANLLKSEGFSITIAQSESEIKGALDEFTDEYIEQNFVRRINMLNAIPHENPEKSEYMKEMPFVIVVTRVA